jgi:predicted nuclease of predicted toxin-antitoxin system
MTVQFTRIVVDENVPREVVEWLKKMDFKEVYWILEKCPGISDPEVWHRAPVKKAVLLTGDIGYLSQLEQSDVLNGPDVIEYSTSGFGNTAVRLS